MWQKGTQIIIPLPDGDASLRGTLAHRTVTRTRYNAEGNPPVSVQKLLVSTSTPQSSKWDSKTQEINLTSYAKCLRIILMNMLALKIGHHNKLFSILCLIALLNACVQYPSAPSDDSDRTNASGENTLPPTLHPKAQRALDKVLAEGLAEYDVYGDRGPFENIEPFFEKCDQRNTVHYAYIDE